MLDQNFIDEILETVECFVETNPTIEESEFDVNCTYLENVSSERHKIMSVVIGKQRYLVSCSLMD